jgi:putative ATP-dependent endonuclease of OLD family
VRVTRVEIERFLGFKSLQIDIDRTLQLIAGPNNAGKSSLIRLIETFFSNPTGDDLMKLFPLHDYYAALGPRTLSSIQLWFENFDAEEQETFSSVIRGDGKMSIALRCGRSGSVTYRASRKASAEDSQQLYQEVLDRFHFVKIPSVRVGGAGDRNEPESLERLLDTLEAILVRTGSSRSTSLQQEFASRISPVEALVGGVLNDSAAAIKADLPFQEQDVTFKLPDPRFALRGMLEAAIIESQGDVDVPVAQRGTGFQSALVLGILRYVASREAQSGGNVLFAIEEPEAFLHPQTQRAMAKIIRGISQDAQVLVTTHSSVLVDSFILSKIARLPLRVGGTEYHWPTPSLEPTVEGRLSRYCSAANSELVFANAAIFVEGEGDHGVIEKLLARACDSPGGHYARGVTVIEASGLGKIKHLVALAELFGVRSYVIADIDGVRKAGGTRVLTSVLKERKKPIDQTAIDKLITVADTKATDLKSALATQKKLNALLSDLDAFVLSSDLEGLLLDSLGVDDFLDVLGPSGECEIDDALIRQFKADTDPYTAVARWAGSKGWNSDRKTSGKLDPHVPPLLVDHCFKKNGTPQAPIASLVTWLDEILEHARPTPV